MRILAIAVGLMLIGSTSFSDPAAADCINYADYLHWECMVDLPDWCMDVSMSGTFAVVALNLDWRDGGLRVIDVADPENPQIVGRLGLGAPAIALSVAGRYAYVLGQDSFWVVDLTDARNPVLHGTCAVAGMSLATSGTYAYAGGYGALFVIDVADPDDPRVVGEVSLPSSANGVDISGTNLYAASSWDAFALTVVDIADPTNPRVIGTLEAPQGVEDVVVSGNHAYLVGSTFFSVDISDPQHPVLLGSVPTGGGRAAVLSGEYVFQAGGDFESVDVSDPEYPRVAGRTWTGGGAGGITVSGTQALVAEGSGIHFIDVANPEAAPVVTRLEMPWAYDLAFQGTDLYATLGDSFAVIDIADPRNPWVVGRLDTPSPTFTVSVAGPFAYAAGTRFYVIDIQDPAHPAIVGSVYTQATPGPISLALSGHYAYVACYEYGLGIIDIADPEHPAMLGYMQTSGYVIGVVTAGSLAYIIDVMGGLLVADISLPDHPRIVGRLLLASSPGPSSPMGLAVSGRFVYIGTGNALQVVDVNDPQSPRLVGIVSTGGASVDVAIAGTIAYLARDGGLQVIDVSDPASPRIIGDSEIPWRPWSLVITGSQAYVGEASQDGYSLRVLELQCEGASGIAAYGDFPSAPGLRICPNPARNRTAVRITVAERGWLAGSINDVTGRRLRLLYDGVLAAGSYELVWDGRDDRGREVPPGLYFVRCIIGGRESTGRVVVAR